MTRKKVELELAIKSWDEANQVMRRIGELGMLKTTRENQAQLKIDEIKASRDESIAPLTDELKQLEKDLKLFAEAERGKRDYKSKALTFGTVFFRQRSGLRTLKKWTWKKAAEAICLLGRMEFLAVKYEVKRDELRQSEVPDDQLAAVGLERYSERPFTYEINEDKVKEESDTPRP